MLTISLQEYLDKWRVDERSKPDEDLMTCGSLAGYVVYDDKEYVVIKLKRK